MKIGIFFGGQSREREISFAGGRTVYDNLNKNLFEAVPIFIDSLGNFIYLDWQYVYKGTIRDFYPPVKFYPDSEKNFQLYIESLGKLSEIELNTLIESVGKKVSPSQFSSLFDFAFLALHGPFGEDGNIQGILEWYGIPYSGCGILPSSIGINKLIQKKLMSHSGFNTPDFQIIKRDIWLNFAKEEKEKLFIEIQSSIGQNFVVKAPNQGSSIGVSVVNTGKYEDFENAVYKSLFIQEIKIEQWKSFSESKKHQLVFDLVDIRVGIGLPVNCSNTVIYKPSELLNFIENEFANGKVSLLLENLHGEEYVLIEQFVKGMEFSCIVIQDENGNPIALPPTQIVKGSELFDYRSKYLPGISRKITPIDLPIPHIEMIRDECARLFESLFCNVYARIDGFFAEDGKIYLNDPNTTSGMMPSSFFFHQAAEIGLNPSQFLTYIIRTSLAERVKTGKKIHAINQKLLELDSQIGSTSSQTAQKIKIAVIMGGYSTERHISVESGRNVFEKLASSTKYEPVPVFLTGSDEAYELYTLPINILLKDNADDIKAKILTNQTKHPVIEAIVNETKFITHKYTGGKTLGLRKISIEELCNEFQEVFIALHGRPGEDGNLQSKLDEYKMPYNGSGVGSSSITINKYETNERLMKAGILVAKHKLVDAAEWSKTNILSEIENDFAYPFIAKPHDDGCSSAVKKIKNRDELQAYGNMMFRSSPEFLDEESKVLHLKYHEEFPQKRQFLIEELITANGAKHFLEVTGGLLTKKMPDGSIHYEMFEPSESLASGEILSLEEKFLAGEGQNITPARYSKNTEIQQSVSKQVRETLQKAAQTLNVEGYCRIDAFVRIFDNYQSETIVIEINSLPGMTPATCIFHQCALNGYKPYEFIDNILEYGKQRVAK
jgi:D-alanine-D-alanine ligase